MQKLVSFNVGPSDRAIRIVLGIALLALVFLPPHTAWGWLGLIPLVTGVFGVCPLYGVFNISTNTPKHPVS